MFPFLAPRWEKHRKIVDQNFSATSISFPSSVHKSLCFRSAVQPKPDQKIRLKCGMGVLAKANIFVPKCGPGSRPAWNQVVFFWILHLFNKWPKKLLDFTGQEKHYFTGRGHPKTKKKTRDKERKGTRNAHKQTPSSHPTPKKPTQTRYPHTKMSAFTRTTEAAQQKQYQTSFVPKVYI